MSAEPQRTSLPAAGARAIEIAPELIERCRQGSRAAFDELFELAGDHVYTLALHFSGDEATAADVTQEVFLKLLGRIGQFRREAEFSTWLYRIVANTFLDHRRGSRPWVSLEEAAVAPQLVLPAPQEEARRRAELAADVRRAVATLKPHQRLLVVLRYSAGLSYEEIAAATGVRPGTVASRLARVHARLAGKLRQS